VTSCWRTVLAVGALSVVTALPVLCQNSREAVYNRVSRGTTDLDSIVDQVYGGKYEVRPIQEDDRDYVPASVATGRLPSVVLDDKGAPIRGYALLLYVIKNDGVTVDPIVVKSTDPRIDGPAKAAILRARFKPATWKGKPIAIVAGQEFVYDRE